MDDCGKRWGFDFRVAEINEEDDLLDMFLDAAESVEDLDLESWDIDRHNRNYDKIFQKSGMFCSLKNKKKSPKSGSFLTVFC